MGKLRVQHHELFAQARAASVPLLEAYSSVYAVEKDKHWRRKARQLDQRIDVRMRITEIIEESAALYVVTTGVITQMLRQAYDVAAEDRNPSAMVSAAQALTKLYRLDEPPAAADDPLTKRFEQMTEQEIRFMWANMLADIRAVKATLPAPKTIEHDAEGSA